MSPQEQMDICRQAKKCRHISRYELILFIVQEFNIFQREKNLEPGPLTPEKESDFDYWLREKYLKKMYRLSA